MKIQAAVGLPPWCNRWRRLSWILSRTPALDPPLLEAAFASLESNGYRRARFTLTPQD